jgi:hypothetical protein
MESNIQKQIVALKLRANLAETLLIDKVLDIVKEEAKDAEYKLQYALWESKRLDFALDKIIKMFAKEHDEKMVHSVRFQFESAGRKFEEQNPRPVK